MPCTALSKLRSSLLQQARGFEGKGQLGERARIFNIKSLCILDYRLKINIVLPKPRWSTVVPGASSGWSSSFGNIVRNMIPSNNILRTKAKYNYRFEYKFPKTVNPYNKVAKKNLVESVSFRKHDIIDPK